MVPVFLTITAPHSCALPDLPTPQAPVLVAVDLLAEGQTLSADDLCIAWLPVSEIPPAALSLRSPAVGLPVGQQLPRGTVLEADTIGASWPTAVRRLLSDSWQYEGLSQGDQISITGRGWEGQALTVDTVLVVSASGSDGLLISVPPDDEDRFEEMTASGRLWVRRVEPAPADLLPCEQRWAMDGPWRVRHRPEHRCRVVDIIPQRRGTRLIDTILVDENGELCTMPTPRR